MWVHPDLIESRQWTTVTNRKSKGKAKASPCNVVYASYREAEADVLSLINSEEKTIILAAEQNAPLLTETHSGQLYLKKYDGIVANPPGPTAEPTSPPQSNL